MRHAIKQTIEDYAELARKLPEAAPTVLASLTVAAAVREASQMFPDTADLRGLEGHIEGIKHRLGEIVDKLHELRD